MRCKRCNAKPELLEGDSGYGIQHDPACPLGRDHDGGVEWLDCPPDYDCSILDGSCKHCWEHYIRKLGRIVDA